MFRFIVDLFHRILESVDRLLYTVDELLRFRSGERKLTTAVRGAPGIGWSAVNYTIRFCVTLLIEPQVNPIKHFPVVTVSHKLIWPLHDRTKAVARRVPRRGGPGRPPPRS